MDVFPAIAGPAAGVWAIAALGLTAFLWNRESRAHATLVDGLLLFSFLAVCPGFFFREHYFILMLPAVALLVGIAVASATQLLVRTGRGLALSAIPVLLFAVAFSYSVVQQRASLFRWGPKLACERVYGPNPFTEAVAIGGYLDAHTSASDRIAVLGSEPEIFFYAKRHSATGFIYIYGLLEQQRYAFKMQQQMFNEIESARPEFLVAVINRLSWLPRPGSPELLSYSSWANSYIGSEYEKVGVAERVGDHTEYRWGDEAKAYQPHSPNIVWVFKRKS